MGLTLGLLGNENQIGERGTRVLAHDCYPAGVTAEGADVLLGPSQRGDYVQHAEITRWIGGACLQEAYAGRRRASGPECYCCAKVLRVARVPN